MFAAGVVVGFDVGEDFGAGVDEGAALIAEASGLLQQMDPTRPIMQHQGGPRTDICASNTYLNYLPLQEREKYPRAMMDRSSYAVMKEVMKFIPQLLHWSPGPAHPWVDRWPASGLHGEKTSFPK